MRRLFMVPMLLLGTLTMACGQGPQGAFLDLAFERNGLDEMVTLASVVVLDADTAPAWMGAERAGLSASAAPNVEAPLDVCRVESNVGSNVNTLHLLDPGLSRVRGPSSVEQSLTATAPAFGDGTGYTARFEAGELEYQAGGAYELVADGAEAPAFSASFTAPADFEIELLGFITPGPGTAVLPSTTDLTITWAPASTDKEVSMYLVLTAAESRVICRARDDGSFTIKDKYLQDLPLGDALLEIERGRFVKLGISAGSTGKIRGQARIGLRYTYPAELQ